MLPKGISSCRLGRCSSVVVEAIGVREALSWLKHRNLGKVIVESDCPEVVRAIRNSLSMTSYFERIIEECKILLDNLKHVSLFF